MTIKTHQGLNSIRNSHLQMLRLHLLHLLPCPDLSTIILHHIFHRTCYPMSYTTVALLADDH